MRDAAGRADDMSEESWDASAFAGSKGRYRVYDTHEGGWGHIAVDNIRCSSCGGSSTVWTKKRFGSQGSMDIPITDGPGEIDLNISCMLNLSRFNRNALGAPSSSPTKSEREQEIRTDEPT